MDPFIILIIIFSIIIVAIPVTYYVHWTRTYKKIRNSIEEEYEISIPQYVRVDKRNENHEDENYYVLGFPSYKSNGEIDWKESTIYVGEYMLSSTHPDTILNLVDDLRYVTNIKPCNEEKRKAQQAYEEKISKNRIDSIDDIVAMYEKDDAGFDTFLAEIFSQNGYTTKTVKRAKANGFAFTMEKDRLNIIVGSKCAAPSSLITPLMLQKLVNANGIVCANTLLFVTTGNFTSECIYYARSRNIALINGNTLFSMIKNTDKKILKEKISKEEYLPLEVSDLKKYMPEEIFEEYFTTQ